MSSPKFSRSAFSALAFAVAPVAPVEDYAAMMIGLFPPGRLWNFVTGTIRNLVLGCAEELARVHERVLDLLVEGDPARAVELLPEYEAELDVAGAATEAEGRARVLARLIARQRFRPADFVAALTPLLGTMTVIERTTAQAAAMGDVREIFRFFIYRNPSDPGTYYLSSAQTLVDEIKPSHTIGHVIESTSFLCDDPFSLCDRDILGA